jgi:3-oxoacyl-[acyl-carrier protein] reductase
MSDYLLDVARSPAARRLIQSAGLPIPMPEPLARTSGPWVERPLEDRTVVVGGKGALGGAIAQALIGAGASPVLSSSELLGAFDELGEAYGRRARVVDGPTDERPHALVFDATGFSSIDDVRGLYDFFHVWVTRIGRSGRAVIVGRPHEAAGSAAEAAARAALDGFTRSLAKEIGRKGATANFVIVDEGAEGRAAGVIRFLLSPASAFVSAQPLRVSARAALGEAPALSGVAGVAGVAGAPAAGGTRSLEGKVALVTGAARGIGAATAERLALEGARVVCLDRPDDAGPLSQVARAIGGTVLAFDVSDRAAPQAIAEALQRELGGVDLVVHNAGITRDKTLARMSEELWDRTIDINLGAVERITSALAQGALRDGGRVVCLSSIAGIAGNMGQTNYAASKAGVIGLVRRLAVELEGRGITVNAIAPGFIETRLTAAIPVVIREFGRRLSALGQGGQPEDVASAIAFLCTPGAAGLTGNVLRVCGGALIGA